MEQIRWGNHSSCCRLCLDDKRGSLRSIFEDVMRGNALVEQIHEYIGIEVRAGDKLTTMICEQCLSKVHMWNAFKKSCSENQEKLINWMNSWEASNGSNLEIEIKQEAMDPFDGDVPMEDVYDEPPPLSPHMPENIYVNNIEGNHLEVDEIDQFSEKSSTFNGMVVLGENTTICSYCNKNFSNPFNRRRHERDVHESRLQHDNIDPLATHKYANTDVDVRKIQFAAGLQLKQRSKKYNSDNFTNVEIAYLEKFKNIIIMMDTLACVCHNEKFAELKELFLHLKKQRLWFAMFTCYNCLITFSDRGSYMRHYCSCQKDLLFNTRRLSDDPKKSQLKIRIYQNFKCLKCDIIYAFYEEFCAHLDETHMEVEEDSSVYTCVCSQTFEDVDTLKQHRNASCFIAYYCDACFTCYGTIEDFKRHCEEEHDDSEGSSLELYDYYHKSKVHLGESSFEANNDSARPISARRRTLNHSVFSVPDVKPLLIEVPEQKHKPKQHKVINPHAFRNMKSSKAATCPECGKTYSSYHNMLRHYTLAHDEAGLIIPCKYCPDRFRLISELKEHELNAHQENGEDDSQVEDVPKFSCPDCKDMFKTLEEWKKHVESHPKQTCKECGKKFNLRSDLEQHRSVHLNIKVYKDSKTQNYKSAMLSPVLNCTVCEITFNTKQEMLQHNSLHDEMPELPVEEECLLVEKKSQSSKFSCQHCDKTYLSYAGIYDHIKKNHPEQEPAKEFPKQCPHCDKVLQTKGAYGNHQRMHKRIMGLLPKVEEGVVKGKVTKLPSDDSEESYYTCKKCFKVFSSKSNLKNHMKSHGISINNHRNSVKSGKVLKTYWCDICHQACIGYAELQEHKQEHRQEKVKVTKIVSEPDLPQNANPFIFNCDICSQSFSTNFALRRHREKHEQVSVKPSASSVYCKYCKVPFTSTAAWNEHMVNEHEESLVDVKPDIKLTVKTHACKLCKKVFANASALSSHQGWHKRGKVAKKVFNDMKPIKSEFVSQQNRIEINAHKCGSCALQFVNETALQIHILETHRNITRVLQLNCSSCRINFDSKTAYDAHMESHKVIKVQTAKPFACTYCPARFSRRDRLRGHLKLHHGEYEEGSTARLNCTQCDRSFDKQAALIMHLKVHERRRLAVSGNEVSKAVTNKNIYVCSICDMGFTLPKDLRTHVIAAHPF